MLLIVNRFRSHVLLNISHGLLIFSHGLFRPRRLPLLLSLLKSLEEREIGRKMPVTRMTEESTQLKQPFENGSHVLNCGYLENVGIVGR